MKLKEGIIISEINGEFVAVPSGKASKSFNGMIRMNQTAALIVKMLQNGATEQEVVDAICQDYDVSAEIAREDYAAVIEQFKQLNLVEHDDN